MASRILLTGASGFLGCHLLSELMATTTATVVCLVRGKSEADARSRLRGALDGFDIAHSSWGERVVVVPGDLSRRELGLSPRRFDALAEEVDAIYHNGALVNFVLPYAQLRGANVVACSEILRLATLQRTKPVHFTSTLRVFPSTAPVGTVFGEDAMVESPSPMHTGYAQSKWAAEKMMRAAQARGLPVSVYRVGLVSGHSGTGAYGLSDLIPRALKGCIQLGTAPRMDADLDWTPVDFVAKVLVHVGLSGGQRCGDQRRGVFHVLAPAPTRWSQLVQWLVAAGYPVAEVAYERWRDQLTEVTRRSPTNALAPLQGFFRPHTDGQAIPRYGSENLSRALADSSVRCPPIDVAVFERYLRYFVRRGFLDPVGADIPRGSCSMRGLIHA